MNMRANIGYLALLTAGLVLGGCQSENGGTAEAAKAEVVASTEKAANEIPNTLEANKAKATDDIGTEAKNDPKTKISFAGEEHDFGKIMQDSENTYIFKFTNSGTQPLIIYSAKGSCGCTVPEYPKEPIAPGEDGEIKVVYKPGKQKDMQTKFVTLTANTEPEQTKLKITAEVQVKEG
ncbi:MAG: DUF1573 domain-containing protein [Bacteroidetes bacterium]|jgi:hypothetical protein|nr:DUF1573 domain-containing protein [Bacteroidota bacterium]